jgi:hypothetical protein
MITGTLPVWILWCDIVMSNEAAVGGPKHVAEQTLKLICFHCILDYLHFKREHNEMSALNILILGLYCISVT